MSDDQKQQFMQDAKMKAISIASTLQPQGYNSQAISQGITDVKSVKNLLSDSQLIYDWIIKDLI